MAIAAARHPRSATGFALLLALACLALLPQLTFDDDIERAFLSNSERSKDYIAFREKVERGRDLIVYARSHDRFTKAQFEALRDLAFDLELTNGIARVASPFSMRFAPTHPIFPGEAVLPATLDTATVDTRLRAFDASSPLLRNALSDDHRAALLVASTQPALTSEETDLLFAATKPLLEAAQASGLDVVITGELAMSRAIASALKSDLLRLNLLGALLVSLLAMAIFRNIATALAAIVPALGGVASCLAVFAVLDYPVTVISNILPVLILGLGVADSLHLVVHHARQKPGTDVEHTLRDVGPACALTALTTAVAFLMIAVADNDQLVEFAIAGALSVVISFFAVTVLFALLAPLIPQQEVSHNSEPALSRLSTLYRHHRPVFAGFLALLIFATIGFWRTEPWFNHTNNLPSNAGLTAVNEHLEQRFGGFYRLWFELPLQGGNALDSEDDWQRLRDLTENLEQIVPDATILSMVTIARWLDEPAQPPADRFLNDLPEDLVAALNPQSQTATRILVLVPEPMRDATTLARHDALESAALAAGASRITGLPHVMRHEALSLIGQLSLGLLGACLFSVLLIAAAFRWGRLAVALAIPNALPLVVTAAALHVLNEGLLNPTAVLALTIAFGIAVDDSIHFVNRYLIELRKERDVDTALKSAVAGAGRPMVLTTLLLSLGLAVTLTSAFAPVMLFGQLLVLSLVVALLADLLFLPALLRLSWFRP